jgi:hypothetical protein
MCRETVNNSIKQIYDYFDFIIMFLIFFCKNDFLQECKEDK